MSWSYVRSVGASTGNSTASTEAVSVAVSAGDLIVVNIMCAAGGLPVSSVGDGASNTYHYLTAESNVSGSGAWYWAQARTTATLTITVTFAANCYNYIEADVYSVAPGSTISVASGPAVVAAGELTGASLTTGNNTFSGSGNFLSWGGGVSSTNNADISIGGSYTQTYAQHSASGDVCSGYLISPTSPQTITITQPNSAKATAACNVIFLETLETQVFPRPIVRDQSNSRRRLLAD